MAAKDFGPIETDYAFFMAHATEAECDAAEYVRQLDGFADARTMVRMLDFGCGTGEFTERLLSQLAWPASRLQLTVCEPVSHQRAEATRRLAGFSERAVETADVLPEGPQPQFDLIVSNHVLYYVDDMDATLAGLLHWLAPGGRLVVGMSGWDNFLMQLWQAGFHLLGRPVPYYAADDLETALSRKGVPPGRTTIHYRLRFPDGEENRLRILRFLFANYLDEMPLATLLSQFDRHVQGGHVDVQTPSYHYELAANS